MQKEKKEKETIVCEAYSQVTTRREEHNHWFSIFFFLVFTGQNLKINKHRNIPTDEFWRWLLLCWLKSFHSQQKHFACPWHHHDGGSGSGSSRQSSSSQSSNTKQSVCPALLVSLFSLKMSLLCTNKPKSERRDTGGGRKSRWEQLAHTHTRTHTALYTLLNEALSFLHPPPLFLSLFHARCTTAEAKGELTHFCSSCKPAHDAALALESRGEKNKENKLLTESLFVSSAATWQNKKEEGEGS